MTFSSLECSGTMVNVSPFNIAFIRDAILIVLMMIGPPVDGKLVTNVGVVVFDPYTIRYVTSSALPTRISSGGLKAETPLASRRYSNVAISPVVNVGVGGIGLGVEPVMVIGAGVEADVGADPGAAVGRSIPPPPAHPAKTIMVNRITRILIVDFITATMVLRYANLHIYTNIRLHFLIVP